MATLGVQRSERNFQALHTVSREVYSFSHWYWHPENFPSSHDDSPDYTFCLALATGTMSGEYTKAVAAMRNYDSFVNKLMAYMSSHRLRCYRHIILPTTRRRIPLEKLIVAQFKKSPAFHGSRRSITVLIQPATGPYPEPVQSILIWYYSLRPVLISGLFR
jgi:hypothetical protein